MRHVCFILAAGLLMAADAAAGLSPNLIANGDFENADAIKTDASSLTGPEVDAGATPVPGGGFHPAFDLGRWIGAWGLTDYADPRAAWGGGEDPAPQNRSVGGGGNHFLEGVSYNAWAGIFVQAPSNMVAGPAELGFDFYFDYWDAVYTFGTPQIFQVLIHGLNAADLPTWQDRFLVLNDGDWANLNPPSQSPQANWERIYTSAEFNSEQHDLDMFGDPERPYLPGQGGAWHGYADGWTEIPPPGHVIAPGEGEDGATLFYDGTFEIDQPYDYFYLTVRMVTYNEAHPYFWLSPGQPADTMAIGVDDFSFQVSVALPGDFDGSGAVDTQDINPFILALTDPAGYASTYGITPDPYDLNDDGLINTEDINPFIALLTGPGSAAAATIPEPGGLAACLIVAAGHFRRRR